MQENKNLKCEIEQQNVDIQDLQISNKIQKQISQKLSKNINETEKKSKKEKTMIYKQHRAEIKSWRLELGDETKEKIKLEEKLKKLSETDASASSSFDPPRNLNSSSPNSIISASESQLTFSSSSKETPCTIYFNTITDYKPKYFLGEEINPACEKYKDYSYICDDEITTIEEEQASSIFHPKLVPEHQFTPKGFNHRPTSSVKLSSSVSNCSHDQQCILRQPFSPPMPALMPLINNYSMYHVKAMAGDLDWGSTCNHCMRIDYEKYGCESCVWIKCFGPLHGFPDVDPYNFKKYL